ncbi:MAG: HD domain-containing protein [Gammaproteobacteria bacterium]|nr:HD domain-containing protein [Gammaproteobacteria bacterium]
MPRVRTERVPGVLAAASPSACPRPELLYLAGLFHDIAKGRGGDHSELGARGRLPTSAAATACRARTAELVRWLVDNHLLMSMTAQRKDISDPQVINEFARQVGDQRRLDHLYLLTVADIRGTDPKLWNSWRASPAARALQA